MAGPPSKLDLHLEGLAAFQEGAAALKAGDPLCLQQLDGARLACSTRDGVAVGLVPADKRGLLSRGPWSGTVRSVKRQQVAPAAGGGQASGSVPATAGATAAGGAPAGEQTAAQQEQQQSAAAAAAAPKQGQLGAQPSAGSTDPPAPAPLTAEAEGQQGQPAAAPQLSVVQVLVRFSPEEQRWEQRAPEAPALPEEEDAARLSADQLQMLADSEELRWMLRDERLQKVVTDIDAAPDRERALLRALQAPNFKEFADKVLAVVAPEPSA